MAFLQVKDIIRETCKEHQCVADYYDEMQDFVEEDKARSLLETMYKHEIELIRGIKGYLDDGGKSTLNTWFQYLPEIPKASELVQTNLHKKSTTDELLRLFHSINSCFLTRYKTFSDISPSMAVHELFDEMMKMEHNQGHREGWKEIMLEDM